MRMPNHSLRTCVLVVIFSALCTAVTGQFFGGPGDGFEIVALANPDSCAYFLGGTADGSDAILLPNPDPCAYFYGDSADGYAAILLPNPDSCGYFWGDSTDGYASALRPNPDTCGFFDGSTSDGAAMSFMASPVDCPTFYGSVSDGFAVGEGFCLPLAVEGSELFGKMENNNGYLWWYTYAEVNNLGFALKRSQNAIDWEEIVFLPGKDHSSGTRKYEHTDLNMHEGVNYYRWDQIDLDGTTTLSNIVQLVWRKDALATSLLLYPVPVGSGDLLNLDFVSEQTGPITVTVISISGQALWQQETLKSESRFKMELPTAALSAGSYVLMVDQAGQRSLKRFVVY